jgi:glutamate/tyrosine decarboxylase-like PLP-dependent enzyme
MNQQNDKKILEARKAPLDMNPKDFRDLGHSLIDQIADFLESLPNRPLTTGEPPTRIKKLIGQGSLPQDRSDSKALLTRTAQLLFDHSLFNGHPQFYGYITSSAAPIGALADLLAAAVNPNVGAWNLAPVASEIESQTIRWIAEMIGYPTDCGGILVSGGNMANFVCFLAARHAKAGWDLREEGMQSTNAKRLRVYASKETHTWLHKAMDMFGLGNQSIRWINLDSNLRMDTAHLQQQIERDKQEGYRPFLVIGTAGTVGTGKIDPLPEISEICKKHDLWFHVDGAYGAFAAVLPDASQDLLGLSKADSVAVDPHKWLYAPLEVGCSLVRDPNILRGAFSYHPEYYKFAEVGGEPTLTYNEYGPQNSRGFRALKVWLALQQVGRSGYEKMISDDINLAERLFQLIDEHPELEAFTNNLSITTFRSVPKGFNKNQENADDYLNKLNTEILTRLQEGGEAFVSNTVLDGKYLLRACIVNFRTSLRDIERLVEIVVRIGHEVSAEINSK